MEFNHRAYLESLEGVDEGEAIVPELEGNVHVNTFFERPNTAGVEYRVHVPET